MRARPSDSILVKNKTNIEQLIESVRTILQWFAYQLTKNKTDAEDLYQETVLKILGNQEKFLPETNFKARATTIMRNLFINQYRKKQKQLQRETAWQLSGTFAEQNTIPNVEWDLNLEQIGIYIQELNDTIRIPFVMHVLEGKKYQDIAYELGIPLWTIKSRIFFARKELKKRIKKEMW